jgi:hypothetical protein
MTQIQCVQLVAHVPRNSKLAQSFGLDRLIKGDDMKSLETIHQVRACELQIVCKNREKFIQRIPFVISINRALQASEFYLLCTFRKKMLR